MSLKYIVKAFGMKVGSASKKLVLLKLADNCNDQGQCFPSYQHIADQCEMDRRTVMRHIKQFQESGLVSIEHREGPKGNSSNIFTLHLPSDPLSLGGDPVSLPPSDPVSPRTCHSIESVNEPYGKHSKLKSIVDGLDEKSWSEWLSYKVSIKDKYKTENGEQKKAAALIKLSNETGLSQASLVSHAIDEEWKGIYAPRQQHQQPQPKRPRAFGQ